MPFPVDYVVLRFVPDPMRGEALNAGIVVFKPGRPLVYLDIDERRLKALHPDLGSLDYAGWADRITEQLTALENRDEQLAWLVHGLSPLTIDRSIGQLEGDSPEVLDAAVDDVLDRWVRSPKRSLKTRRRRAPTSRLHAELMTWLRQAKLFSPKLSDISNRRVVSNYPVSIEDDLFAEFAMKNGAIHIVETLDLRGVERLTKARHGEVGLKAVLLDQARSITTSDGQRVLLTAADDYPAVKPAIHLLNKYADRIFASENTQDRQAFADFMSKSLDVESPLLPLGGFRP
jgi:hypothetical protein